MRIILSVILFTILVSHSFSNYFIIDSPAPAVAVKFDTGDTAWMIVATALVLIMTPGLGFLRWNGR
jgi:Amt family ammonium transporter